MKYLKTFLEHKFEPTIYEIDWHSIVPDKLVVIKGDTTDINGYIIEPKTKERTTQLCEYKVGNIMSDLVYQITYDNNFNFPGIPDTLEIDVAILKDENENHFEINVEITFGNLIVSGFNIDAPNKVTPYQYTSYHSKNDPSNTVFAFNEESLQKLLTFFNSFDSIHLERKDLNFLDNNPDSYMPS
jgi:hypothetical protein